MENLIAAKAAIDTLIEVMNATEYYYKYLDALSVIHVRFIAITLNKAIFENYNLLPDTAKHFYENYLLRQIAKSDVQNVLDTVDINDVREYMEYLMLMIRTDIAVPKDGQQKAEAENVMSALKDAYLKLGGKKVDKSSKETLPEILEKLANEHDDIAHRIRMSIGNDTEAKAHAEAASAIHTKAKQLEQETEQSE